MSKLYNTPFKVGFAFNILVFAVLNIASFINSRYEAANFSVVFNSVIYPRWGFPTDIYTTVRSNYRRIHYWNLWFPIRLFI